MDGKASKETTLHKAIDEQFSYRPETRQLAEKMLLACDGQSYDDIRIATNIVLVFSRSFSRLNLDSVQTLDNFPDHASKASVSDTSC